MSQEKVYLGEDVYALFDGFNLVLTNEDGTEEIFLEPDVVTKLVTFLKENYLIKG